MKREKILEKERNLVEYKSISGSIDASSEEDNSEDEYISMNSLENIRSGKNWIQISMQEMPDWRYVTELGNNTVSVKDQNSQRKEWEKFYTRYLM